MCHLNSNCVLLHVHQKMASLKNKIIDPVCKCWFLILESWLPNLSTVLNCLPCLIMLAKFDIHSREKLNNLSWPLLVKNWPAILLHFFPIQSTNNQTSRAATGRRYMLSSVSFFIFGTFLCDDASFFHEQTFSPFNMQIKGRIKLVHKLH